MKAERRNPARAAPAPAPAVVGLELEGVILRRDPSRLGGVCTVCLVVGGREVEVIRDFADMIDHHVWAPSLRELLQQKGQA